MTCSGLFCSAMAANPRTGRGEQAAHDLLRPGAGWVPWAAECDVGRSVGRCAARYLRSLRRERRFGPVDIDAEVADNLIQPPVDRPVDRSRQRLQQCDDCGRAIRMNDVGIRAPGSPVATPVRWFALLGVDDDATSQPILGDVQSAAVSKEEHSPSVGKLVKTAFEPGSEARREDRVVFEDQSPATAVRDLPQTVQVREVMTT